MKRLLACLLLLIFSALAEDSAEDSVERLHVERDAYRAVSETMGWKVAVYKKDGVWWVLAAKAGAPPVEMPLYDQDKSPLSKR